MAPVWTRRIADEFWSGAVTPLTYSLLAETMVECMVRGPLRTAGLPSLAELPVLHHTASHVFVNASLLAEVIDRLPAGLQSEGLLGMLPKEVRDRIGGSSWLSGGTQAVTIVARLLTHEPSWAPWRRAAAFEAECARVRADLDALAPPGPDATVAALLDDLTRVRDRLGEYLAVVSWAVVFAYVFYHLSSELARRWAPDLVAERAALTVGLPGIATVEAAHEIADLGRLLASDRGLMTIAHEQGPQAAWSRIAEDGGAIGTAARMLLERRGHRLTGRDLACPTWRETPEVVIGLAVRSLDARQYGGSAASDEAAQRRASATAAIMGALGGGLAGAARRAAFQPVLALAQRYYAVRENMRYHADYFLARMRAVALALGARLCVDGRLTAPDDVCFLSLDEIAQALADERSLATVVAERRAAFAHDVERPPPETLVEDARAVALEASAVSRPGSPLTLRGEIASPGHCRAPARVVHGPADFDRVRSGDVLVAAYVDPGWTPVIGLASGLVLEVGGQLSHGAIVARELGIPAVVGVIAATRSIPDGATLEIDGAAGVVTVTPRAGST